MFIAYTSRCDHGFLGIEVKYAETMSGKVARHRARYDEVAHAMECFISESLSKLRQKPLEQFWRNHLLVGRLALDPASGFKEGTFVVLYPTKNTDVRCAAGLYRDCLCNEATFKTWTLESVLDALVDAGGGPWVQNAKERYLG